MILKETQESFDQVHGQWITAGSGVVHSELPEKEFLQNGGKLHAFQLWINLPKRDKMINPRYQDIPLEKFH